MPVAFHVNGPAVIWCADQGLAGALVQLGISEDGVGITLQQHDEPIMTDDAGTRIPHDLQDMGEDALIDFRLVYYDLDVLRRIRRRRMLPGAGINQPARGVPIFTALGGFRLAIQSDTDEPWRFFFCTTRGAQRARVGTRRTAWDMSVYAIPGYTDPNNKKAGRQLYDHVFK